MVADPGLPASVQAAFAQAGIPLDAVGVVVQPVGLATHRASWNAEQPMNPASVIKLATTVAALDLLGPAWTWVTPVYVQGPVRDGVLDGHVYLKGSGDPRLVLEKVWLLLKRLQQSGVREVRGDIVLDRSAFAPAEQAPEDFDGDPTRPYNVQPDALLLNFKAVTHTFVPDPARGVARISTEPSLGMSAGSTSGEGVTVPLTGGPCNDWRRQLKIESSPLGHRFAGTFPAACGEQTWPLADPEPATYAARLVETLWRDLGGRLSGRVRDGVVPTGLKPWLEWRSEPLAETVRAINKYSNNVMAQQLFLTLGLQGLPGGGPPAPANPDTAREVLRRWAADRLPPGSGPWTLDNGSGLSRQTRVSARWVAALLQHAWASPAMPELMSSLPVAGQDGTLRRARGGTGRAHLKTGSLRDVSAVAGYALGDSGRRYVVVALVQHPQAAAARPALDALVQWVIRDTANR